MQGRYPARDMVKWADGGFFTSDQKVRQSGWPRLPSITPTCSSHTLAVMFGWVFLASVACCGAVCMHACMHACMLTPR